MNNLQEGQFERLLNIIKNKKYFLITHLLQNKLKPSQIISLKMDSFNFQKKVIIIPNTEKKITLNASTYQALSNYIKTQKNLTKNSYIFPSTRRKENHISRKSINKYFERISLKHIEFKNLNPTTIQQALPQIKKENIFKKIKRTLFKNKKRKIIQIDTQNRDIELLKTYGRSKEIEKIKGLISKKINSIILGGVGVGKSHLINVIADDYKHKCIRIDDIYEIKKTLVNILLYLYKGDKQELKKQVFPKYDYEKLANHLQKDSLPSLCRQIISVTQKKEYLLIIDSCDRITPRASKILEDLKDHFIILTSTREVSINKSTFLWNFEMLKIKNLQRKHALGMIIDLSSNLEVEDKTLFRNHIFEQSVGNPRVISELIDRYGKEEYITADVVREIRHTGSLKEFDCSWTVIVLLGFISSLRFMSHELGNDSLRFIGGCSVLLLLLIRNMFSKRRVLK